MVCFEYQVPGLRLERANFGLRVFLALRHYVGVVPVFAFRVELRAAAWPLPTANFFVFRLPTNGQQLVIYKLHLNDN